MSATGTIFMALADPTRRTVLRQLAEQSPATATSLAAAFPITRQALLKHLTLLERAGLVTASRHGRERRYELTPEPLEEVAQWVHELGALWDARLLRLKALVEHGDAQEVPREHASTSSEAGLKRARRRKSG